MVLLGASNDMGWGVKNDQTYENLVEDNLNSRVPDARYSRYEILNLSVAADSILQRVLRLEQEGFEFQPDAAILSVSGSRRAVYRITPQKSPYPGSRTISRLS